MKTLIAAATCALLLGTSAARAEVFDLRGYFDTLDFSLPQAEGSLWTAHYGDAAGSLLPPAGSTYGYGSPIYTQLGYPVNTGDSYWNGSFGYGVQVTPTFDGLFLHTGTSAASSVAIVFTAQETVWLDGVTVLTEMVSNGLAGNGVDIVVSHVRDGVATDLDSYLVSGADASIRAISFGAVPLMFAAGDRIIVDVGPNGSNLYDHVNIDVMTSAVAAPVPEPEAYALILAGLAMVGFAARRRRAD